MKYAVITDNGGGENAVWHDVTGEEYSFAKYNESILLPGTLIVYHRSKKKSDSPHIPDRMSDESHYFGVAEIGKVVDTPDGNLRAEIRNFLRFRYPVNIHRPDGTYYEKNPFFQQGVRSSNKSVYDEIVAASRVAPTPAPVRQTKRKGIKSLATLEVVKRSNSFAGGRYEIVTSYSGYYIYNVADRLYYLLEKPASFKPTFPDLRVLVGSCGSFLIQHNGTKIGFIKVTNYGVCYESSVSSKLSPISVNM